jgi:hypothetical protein
VLAMSYPGEAGSVAHNPQPWTLTAGDSQPWGATAISAVREMCPWDATDVLAMSYPGEAGPTAHNPRPRTLKASNPLPWTLTGGNSRPWHPRGVEAAELSASDFSRAQPWRLGRDAREIVAAATMGNPLLLQPLSRATGQPASANRPVFQGAPTARARPCENRSASAVDDAEHRRLLLSSA